MLWSDCLSMNTAFVPPSCHPIIAFICFYNYKHPFPTTTLKGLLLKRKEKKLVMKEILCPKWCFIKSTQEFYGHFPQIKLGSFFFKIVSKIFQPLMDVFFHSRRPVLLLFVYNNTDKRDPVVYWNQCYICHKCPRLEYGSPSQNLFLFISAVCHKLYTHTV